MAVPVTIADCNSTAANNSPAGSDSIGTSLDDYLRAHAAIIRQVYDALVIVDGTLLPKAGGTVTGQINGITPVADANLTRKDYVDGLLEWPAFRAHISGTAQTVSLNTYVKAQLNSEDFDTGSAFSSNAFTPQKEGYYQVNGAIYGGGSGVTYVEAAIYKNGVAVSVGSGRSTGPQVATVSDLIYMNGTTDYIELYGYITASSGGNFDVTFTNLSATFARGI